MARRPATCSSPGDERHPDTGTPGTKVIHNFWRADKVDREALRRLLSCISRFLEPAEAVAALLGSGVEVVDARRFGGAGRPSREPALKPDRDRGSEVAGGEGGRFAHVEQRGTRRAEREHDFDADEGRGRGVEQRMVFPVAARVELEVRRPHDEPAPWAGNTFVL